MTLRTASLVTALFVIPLVLLPQAAVAEVFKCTSAEGKISYSETPCTAAGAKEAIVPILASPAPDPATQGKNWAAENAAANQRAQEAAARLGSTAASAPAQKASAPAKSPKQIADECAANRGVDCDSTQEITRRETEQRTLNAEEEAARHSAVAGRREREKAEAEAKPKPKPKPKP